MSESEIETDEGPVFGRRRGDMLKQSSNRNELEFSPKERKRLRRAQRRMK
jgi:hypothetical protein